jgi:hypothetical protein
MIRIRVQCDLSLLALDLHVGLLFAELHTPPLFFHRAASVHCRWSTTSCPASVQRCLCPRSPTSTALPKSMPIRYLKCHAQNTIRNQRDSRNCTHDRMETWYTLRQGTIRCDNYGCTTIGFVERITKAPRTPFFENQPHSHFYSTVGVYGVETSIAPDDMVQEPAPVNYEGGLSLSRFSVSSLLRQSWRISI